MAIFADYTHINQTISETETYQEDVTYPSDLPEGHPNYELRGQTVAETFPVVTTEETLLESAYIVITNYNFYKLVKNDIGEFLFDVMFKVYGSKDIYLEDENNYLYEDDVVGQYKNIDSNANLRVRGYEIIKELPHINNIIDD